LCDNKQGEVFFPKFSARKDVPYPRLCSQKVIGMPSPRGEDLSRHENPVKKLPSYMHFDYVITQGKSCQHVFKFKDRFCDKNRWKKPRIM